MCGLALLSIALCGCAHAVVAMETIVALADLQTASAHLADIDGHPLGYAWIQSAESSGTTLISPVAFADVLENESSPSGIHLDGLTMLDRDYRDRGLQIIVFPCFTQVGNEGRRLVEHVKSVASHAGIRFPPTSTFLTRFFGICGPIDDDLWRYLVGKVGGGDMKLSTIFLVSCSDLKCRIARFEGKKPLELRPLLERVLATHIEREL